MPVKKITPEEFKSAIGEASPDSVFIDVRDKENYMMQRIKGTVNIPLDALEKSLDFLRRYEKIYVHCRSGNSSEMACKILEDNGFGNIFDLSGGLLAWEEAGLPVEKDSGAPIPMYRQVMIVAGALVVLFVIIGRINPSAYGLPALIGFGLIYGGWSGNCMMAKLLKYAPWNNREKIDGRCCDKIE